MSEQPPPTIPAGPAGAGQETLTPDAIETVLADFRAWLQQAVVSGQWSVVSQEGRPSSLTTDHSSLTTAPDLHTLLEQFVALRHEVNLQTKASRTQQEQNAEALRRLGEAFDALRQADRQTNDEPLRPALKT